MIGVAAAGKFVVVSGTFALAAGVGGIPDPPPSASMISNPAIAIRPTIAVTQTSAFVGRLALDSPIGLGSDAVSPPLIT